MNGLWPEILTRKTGLVGWLGGGSAAVPTFLESKVKPSPCRFKMSMRLTSWFTKGRNGNIPVSDPRYASDAEISEAFTAQREHLLWLAHVITGDAELASRCCVDAQRLSSGGPAMFRDWLLHWARSATVRAAIDSTRQNIHRHTAKYDGLKCAHGGHSCFTTADLESLEKLGVLPISSGLDSFARSVLVLRGVQSAAIQECALMLGASRSAVMAAHCEALDWMARALQQDQNQAAKAAACGGQAIAS